jgi:hypothetical protein
MTSTGNGHQGFKEQVKNKNLVYHIMEDGCPFGVNTYVNMFLTRACHIAIWDPFMSLHKAIMIKKLFLIKTIISNVMCSNEMFKD